MIRIICLLLIHFAYAHTETERVPKIDLKSHSGFPAISKDGKNISVVSIDRGNYDDPPDITFRVLDADNKQMQKLEIRRSTSLSTDEVSKSLDQIRRIAEFLKKNEFSSLGQIKSKDANTPEKFTIGKYVLTSFSTKKSNLVSIEQTGKRIRTINLPLIPISGVCAGNLEHPAKSVLVKPTLHRVWHSEKIEITVIEYGVWGARDGCEGIENFMVIKLTK